MIPKPSVRGMIEFLKLFDFEMAAWDGEKIIFYDEDEIPYRLGECRNSDGTNLIAWVDLEKNLQECPKFELTLTRKL